MKSIKILLLFCIYFLLTFNLSAQDTTTSDSLENILPSLTDTKRLETMSELCWVNLYTDTDKSFKYAKLSIKELLNYNMSDSLLAAAYNDLGTCYLVIGNYDSAMIYLDSSLIIRVEINDERGVVGVRNKIALIYHWRGQYEKALIEQKLVIDFFEQDHDTLNLANAFNNFGELHYELGNYSKAVEIHTLNLKYRLAARDSVGFAATLHNLGNSLIYVGDTVKGLLYLDSSLTYFKKYNREDMIATVYHNTGTIFYRKGMLEEGEVRLNKAINILNKLGYKRDLASSLNTLGEIYRLQKKHNLALKTINKALSLSTSIDSDVYKAYAYQYLSRIYADKQMWDSAYYYSKLLVICNNAVLKQESTDALHKYQVKYETERKEKELLKEKAEKEKLEKENAIIELEIANRNKWITTISGMSLFIILLILVISQRNKREVQAQKDAQIIKERERGLKAVFNAQEEERQRIAKDSHDGIGQQVSAIKLFFQSLVKEIMEVKPELNSSISKIKQMIDEAGQDVRSISHQMMPRALTELGLVDALEDMIDKSFTNSEIDCRFEHFNIKERLPQHVEIGLYRIAQELLNNIIKHSEAKSVDVQLMKMENHCVLIVQDDGKGITDKKQDGIGMLNINNRLRTINGEMNMETGMGEGTTATIRIALS